MALRQLFPVASSWKTIGAFLGIEMHVLDKIKSDEEGVQDCLGKMLSTWLESTSQPSWTDLADAVELISPNTAQNVNQIS